MKKKERKTYGAAAAFLDEYFEFYCFVHSDVKVSYMYFKSFFKPIAIVKYICK